MTTLAGVTPARATGTRDKTGPKPRGDLLVAAIVVSATSIALAVCLPPLRHWFMIPTTLTGILIGSEAVRWFRRGTDVFDPRACAGLLGFQFLYVAPILQVALDEWVTHIYDPPPWREALGTLAILNVIGTSLYRATVTIPSRGRRQPRRSRPMHMPTFYAAGVIAVVLSLIAMRYEIAIFGGIDGFVAAMADEINRVKNMRGMGALILLSEAFPSLIFTLVLVRWRSTFAKHVLPLAALVLALAVTQFFVGGLKGSRSSTLWPLLLALVLVHVLVRRISRKVIVLVAVVMFAYLYIYAFYKAGGVKAIDEVRRTGTVQGAESDTGRDLPLLLTADLGRADIQSVVLDRYLEGRFEPVMGATYVNSLFMFIPDSLFSSVPTSKVDVGSRLLYSPGYEDGQGDSSKIYGMTGEGIINFGLVGGVLSFVAFGLAVRAVQIYWTSAVQSPELAPKLIAPMIWVVINAQGADLDNTLFSLCKYTMPVLLLVFLARQFGRPEAPTGSAQPSRLLRIPR
ncbi:hypothetical protein ABUL04_19140 [Micromonospora harpali]|uniref:Oligosaccharide repeat unit polymerase n=1 Tax=Micromonospora harpali TaxID=1490225 RepID=A0ABW1HKH3_9ACTN